MIRDALLDFGVKREEFEIIPFPISNPEVLLQYTPADAVYYMSICSPWDEEKYQILQSLDSQCRSPVEKERRGKRDYGNGTAGHDSQRGKSGSSIRRRAQRNI